LIVPGRCSLRHCSQASQGSTLDVYHTTVEQFDSMVAQVDCLVDTMARHDDAGPIIDELLDCFEENACSFAVERRRRLINKQQRGSNCKRTSERNPLALAAGKVARICVELAA
jgi:hypothetical protein